MSFPIAARSGFASTAFDIGFIIFGGETTDGITDEICFYFDAFKSWSSAQIWNGVYAIPVKHACMSFSDPYVIVFGGISKSGYSNSIQVYDLRYFIWIQLEVTGMPQIAYHKCIARLEDGYPVLYAFGGQFWDGTPNRNIYKRAFHEFKATETKRIEFNENIIYSESSVFNLDSTFVIIGGRLNNDFSDNSITVWNTSNSNIEMSGKYILPFHHFHSHQAVFYNKKIYIFGGVLIKTGVIQSKQISDQLLELSFDDEIIYLPCSPGTRRDGKNCILCDPGSYSTIYDSIECIKCPAATYLPNKGAIGEGNCLPCNYGFYNDRMGSPYCTKCKVYEYCPIGSTNPSQEKFAESESYFQPRDFIKKTEEVLFYAWYAGISFFILSSFLVILFIFRSEFREKIKEFDFFDTEHNKDGEVMFKNKTIIGGLFSVFSLLGAGYLVFLSILTFSMDNVSETKSLVPYLTLINEAQEIKSDITLVVAFHNYLDTCGNENNKCGEYIHVGIQNHEISCYKINKICYVSVKCKSCSIDGGSEILFSLSERFSYASAISANLTTDSSIPQQKSSYNLFIKPDSDKVLIGVFESKIYFALTPCVIYI